MQTELLEKTNVNAKFAVDIPADEVNKAYDAIVRSLARQVKVPGFRPGKAPRGMIESQVGKDTIAQEVRDALVDRYVAQAIQELELQPIHVSPHAHEPVEGQDYRFEVNVDLYPEITLPNIQDIVIDASAETLTDAMVGETIENLRRENATMIPVERPAQAGDVVEIETLHDGEPSGSTMPIDLEAVSADFGDQLVGKSIDDQVALVLKGPQPEEAPVAEVDAEGAEAAESEASSDAGNDAGVGEDADAGDDADDDAPQDVTLQVVIRDIREKDKPDADDDFAKTLGFDSWDEAEAQIRKSLQAQLDQQAFAEQREEFVEKLIAESNFDVPPSLIERRQRQLLSNLAEQLQQEGMTLEDYIEDMEAQGTREEFHQELVERAENDVKRDLVQEKLLEQRGTTVNDEELERALTYMAQQQRTNVAALKRQLGTQGLENYRFLIARDQAVRETVRELLGYDQQDDEETPETEGAKSEGAESESAGSESAEPAESATSDTNE